MIKVYTTATCPFCTQVKEFLEENGFDFEEVDASASDENREELMEKSGQMGVPVVDVDGDIVVGFEKDKLKDLLDLEEE